ncbi:choice-of-anchor J domain-containing protein [Hymenobacter sp. ASUV-10]|uniref:Choice-of-anchor J domain-containing protein n=1 Tax=Hymenobacter aranciens TaxID=3063996 RepID=A0ABT9B739_9BACT|nr:choice-of-anchor J domain-containing protein [Hymenobacter sp. ASUV-10]MDO7873977.1 choice-of-anchor J domain-containing protein [Hymenobacter sp. ASUV-10]
MKKTLLTALVLAASSGTMYAQQARLSIFEEFSGENCGPCAAYNPALWSLISANPSNVILVKYQSPIPSAGPIYNAYRTVTNARLSYYSVPFAPYGRLNGVQVGDGNITRLTQSNLTQAAAVAAPFAITASHQWIANGDSVSVTVNLSAQSGYAPAGANLRLRAALIEHLEYATAPGTNGEREFHNVVREMYPNAAGTQLANAWTTGQTQTLVLKGRVPSYVNKAASGDTRVVVWVQNETDKAVPQTAVSAYVAPSVDAAASLRLPSSLVCTTTRATINPIVALENTGTSPLTSATIYYKRAGSAWQTYNWTGTLAAAGTTNVALPAMTVAPGVTTLIDSVAQPNGMRDMNTANDRNSFVVTAYDATPQALPIITGFETGGTMPPFWSLYDANGNLRSWTISGNATSTQAHNRSRYMLLHNNFDFPAGETNYILLPTDNAPSGPKFLNFYVAHAQYQTSNDALDVVYSTDCGTTWTPVWQRAGATLATGVWGTTAFRPTQNQWQGHSVSLAAVPVGAMLAFRAISDYGNNVYIDDVEVATAPLAARTPDDVKTLTLTPNPANMQAALTFELLRSQAVAVSVVDELGRTVLTPPAGQFGVGSQQVTINTASLAPGLYTVLLRTADGSLAKRLSVIR